jgi:hypothetical protein
LQWSCACFVLCTFKKGMVWLAIWLFLWWMIQFEEWFHGELFHMSWLASTLNIY